MKPTYPNIKLKLHQTQEIVIGYLVGNCLVAYKENRTSWSIANRQGIVLFRNIESENDALELAQFIDKRFQEYFDLWKEYPEVDLFRMAMWAAPDGRKIYEMIENLRIAPKITMSIVRSLLAQATGRKYYCDYMREAEI